MSIYNAFLMTLGGEPPMVVPVVTVPVSTVLINSVEIQVSPYSGPGSVSKLRLYVALASDPSFTNPISTYDNRPLASGVYPVNGLQAATGYIVKAEYENDKGTLSGPSTVVSFVTRININTNVTKVQTSVAWTGGPATNDTIDLDTTCYLFKADKTPFSTAHITSNSPTFIPDKTVWINKTDSGQANTPHLETCLIYLPNVPSDLSYIVITVVRDPGSSIIPLKDTKNFKFVLSDLSSGTAVTIKEFTMANVPDGATAYSIAKLVKDPLGLWYGQVLDISTPTDVATLL